LGGKIKGVGWARGPKEERERSQIVEGDRGSDPRSEKKNLAARQGGILLEVNFENGLGREKIRELKGFCRKRKL